MKLKASDIKQLTVRQKYLLDRIPQRYNLGGFIAPPDPPTVKKARAAQKAVDRWDKYVGRLRCAHDKRSEALIRKAREAVYFSSEAKALAIIRQVEKLLKTCGE
jgi:hypothetical protein